MKKMNFCFRSSLWSILFLTSTAQLNAQVFTRITEGPLVSEQASTYYSSWGDYDNDGDLDLFQSLLGPTLQHPQGYSLLYQNNCNGSFTQIAEIPVAVLSSSGQNPSSIWVDYDNDGDLDIYIGARGSHIAEYLYENQGNGSFQPVANAITNLPNYTIAETGGIRDIGPGGSVWLDYDNDGLLDFYSGRKEIYHNNGTKNYDVITMSPFQDITEFLRGDAMTTADFNNDGFMDIYICSPRSNAQDAPEMQLYQNTGNGNFVVNDNTGLTSFSALVYGTAWGDIDNDGDLDAYIPGANIFNGSFDGLFTNNGDGTFTNQTSSPVALNSATGQAGGAFADYDNDGDLDLYVTNFSGNRLFVNDGQGNFTNNTSEIVTNSISVESMGACWADTDNDGDLDLFVPTSGGGANDYFFRNDITGTNWLKVHCKGVQSNSNAIGARVYVKATINGQSVWQMREITINNTRGGESGGASSHVVHIGLGDATMIETLKIVWPASGITQEFQNVAPNRFLEIVENVNTIHEMQACLPDLPVENPGYVEGKLYIDNNNNCVYDPGIDNQVVNAPIQASPGEYYTYTDENGDYLFELPGGHYEIAVFPTELGLEPNLACSSEPVREVVVVEGETHGPEPFIVLPPNTDCAEDMDILITSTDNGDFASPCPGESSEFCFTFTNNVPLDPAAGGIAVITFPNGVTIDQSSITINAGSLANPAITLNAAMNQVTFDFDQSIPVNGSVTICMDVSVAITATGPFNVTATYDIEEGLPTQVVGGGFQTDTPSPSLVLSPGSGYTFNNTITANTSSPGNLWIGTLAEAASLDPNHTLNNPDPGTNDIVVDKVLIVDAANDGSNFWCQTITVQPNTQYFFRYWSNNNMDPTSNGEDPMIVTTINGVAFTHTITTQGNITPNWQGWHRSDIIFCTEAETQLTICLSVAPQVGTSPLWGNFAIDNIRLNQQYEAITVMDFCLPFDPNDKTVTPQGCGENGNIGKDEELTYKIRFQNVGEGPAHDVLLRDQLDEDLDLSTMQILASSHAITSTQIIPNNALIVKFDNIHLPAAAFDEAGSHGFLVFKIKPKSGLADGTVIENQTGIYFDRNEVVLTNVTKNTLYDKPNPEAAFTYKHSCSQTGFVYDFTYTGDTPDNARYLWEFEGATTAISTAQNPTGIVFTNGSGLKRVTLTVSRNGCSDMVYEDIQVENGLTANGKKVIICHNGQNMEVSSSSLAAHLAHGDCVGSCTGSKHNKSIQTNSTAFNSSVQTEAGFSVQLLPNPSSDMCRVSVEGLKHTEKIHVEVFNYAGQLQKSFESDQHYIDIQTKELNNGLYFVKVSSISGSIVNKLLIQH